MAVVSKHQVYSAFGLLLWAEAFTFRNQLYKVWENGCRHSTKSASKSWVIVPFIFFPLQYTSKAAVAAFHNPPRAAPQPLCHLFVADTMVVYLLSVIRALPFAVFGDGIKTCLPQFNNRTPKHQRGQILNLHPLPSLLFLRHYGPLPLEQIRRYIPPLKCATDLCQISLFLGQLPLSLYRGCLFVFLLYFSFIAEHPRAVSRREKLNKLNMFSWDCRNYCMKIDVFLLSCSRSVYLSKLRLLYM